MTKFILHGGETSRQSIHNRNFFTEMIKNKSKDIRILLVYFARPKEKWSYLLEDDKRKFLAASTDKILEFTLASKKPLAFIKQIKAMDVIYIRGGSNDLLKKYFPKIKNLPALLKGKVIAGSSAGANLISKYYFATDIRKIRSGLGLFPIKVFCHFFKRDKKELEKLKRYGEELKVFAIPETQFFVECFKGK